MQAYALITMLFPCIPFSFPIKAGIGVIWYISVRHTLFLVRLIDFKCHFAISVRLPVVSCPCVYVSRWKLQGVQTNASIRARFVAFAAPQLRLRNRC